ncbi:MAG: single-stranded DNA-binding protein [Ilumatobacter sp.]|nr:single-stranded DNA-binding protein [Ilumatobacter sp.]
MQYSASNLAVLRGTVTGEPSARELAGGSLVVHFSVATRLGSDASVSVPVAWHDPSPSGRNAVAAEREVVVVGTVRRRFFRSGGATQSRTEVVADRVVPAGRTKTVRSLLGSVAAQLGVGDV